MEHTLNNTVQKPNRKNETAVNSVRDSQNLLVATVRHRRFVTFYISALEILLLTYLIIRDMVFIPYYIHDGNGKLTSRQLRRLHHNNNRYTLPF